MQYLKYYDSKQRLGTRIMWAKCPLAEFVLSFINWCRRCQSFAKKRFTVRSRRSILCLFKKRFSIFTSNEKNWNRQRERGWERLKTIFKDECFFIKLTWSSSSSTNKKVWTFLKRRFFLFREIQSYSWLVTNPGPSFDIDDDGLSKKSFALLNGGPKGAGGSNPFRFVVQNDS